jgi:inhibitor of KinA sporulation pathway (predicted exonuclease)
MLGLTFEGSHHRAIDDARNIVRVARVVLPNARYDLDAYYFNGLANKYDYRKCANKGGKMHIGVKS